MIISAIQLRKMRSLAKILLIFETYNLHSNLDQYFCYILVYV